MLVEIWNGNFIPSSSNYVDPSMKMPSWIPPGALVVMLFGALCSCKARLVSDQSKTKELVAVVLDCASCVARWAGQQVQFHINNMSVVDVLQKGPARNNRA